MLHVGDRISFSPATFAFNPAATECIIRSIDQKAFTVFGLRITIEFVNNNKANLETMSLVNFCKAIKYQPEEEKYIFISGMFKGEVGYLTSLFQIPTGELYCAFYLPRSFGIFAEQINRIDGLMSKLNLNSLTGSIPIKQKLGYCTCGATKCGSSMHSSWCDI